MLQQLEIDKNPFGDFVINEISVLNSIKNRSLCSKCRKSRKLFCYSCYVPVDDLVGHLPDVSLPLFVDIIKHKNELEGKSTAAHAAILSPRFVRIYEYPNIPNYELQKSSDLDTILIYPSSKATSLDMLHQKTEARNNCDKQAILLKYKLNDKFTNSPEIHQSFDKIKRVVFIDSTWDQSKGIYKDDRLNNLPCVVLQNRISQYWRYHRNSPRWYLATVEAIHQFLIEFHVNRYGVNENYSGLKNCFSDQSIVEKFTKSTSDNAYNGQYDNLLFFFKYMYELIHQHYEHDQLKSYKRRLT